VLGRAVLIGVGDIEGSGEVLAQLMAGGQLERLAVAHHALTGQGGGGPGEPLGLGLETREYRDRQNVLQRRAVHLDVDVSRVGGRVCLGGVGGVAALLSTS
jgi:hypothetical protein